MLGRMTSREARGLQQALEDMYGAFHHLQLTLCLNIPLNDHHPALIRLIQPIPLRIP